MGKAEREFHYIDDSLIAAIFQIENKLCSICNDEKPLCLKHWHYPEILTICVDCVSSGAASQSRGLRFHPELGFLDSYCKYGRSGSSSEA